MKIKKGDNVKILSGKDRGKTGEVIQVLKDKETGRVYVVVEGANILKKHLKTRDKSHKGQTIELPAPMDMSNVQLIDPKSKKPTRVGYTVKGEEKKRIAKKSGEIIS